MEQDKKVLIGIPNGSGTFPAAMVQSLLELRKPVPCQVMIIERQMIEIARNNLALSAIQSGATHLLMVDDDNPIPADTLEVLLADDKDIVLAPILSRNPNKDGIHDLCAFYSRVVNTENGPLKLYEHIDTFKDSSPLHKVDGGGTGCMLIKTEVLKKMLLLHKDRIFERTFIKFPEIQVDGKKFDSRSMSEDVEFCERAIKEGFEVWLDDRIRPVHLTAIRGVKYI